MAKDLRPIAAMAAILVVAQLIALLLAPLFVSQNMQVFANTGDPMNSVLYIVLILLFTGLILLVIRIRRAGVMRWLILGSMFLTMMLVFLLPFFLLFLALNVQFPDVVAQVEATILAAALTWGLAKYPEWYLVDAVGVSVAAGVTAILGISFAILPALVLLIGLAVYDALSVYKTKHMVTLADAATSQRLPILIVVPKSRRYSFLKQKGIKEQIASGEERDAMFMGLGDVIIPGILVVSAFVSNANKAATVFGVAGNLVVALFTIVGTLVGFSVLMRYVMKGNPQAGLPLLNTGAILGYLVAYLLVFHDLTFGIG